MLATLCWYSVIILWTTLEIQSTIQLQDNLNFLVGKTCKVTKVNNCKLQVAELGFVKQFNKIISSTPGIILRRKKNSMGHVIFKDI